MDVIHFGVHIQDHDDEDDDGCREADTEKRDEKYFGVKVKVRMKKVTSIIPLSLVFLH